MNIIKFFVSPSFKKEEFARLLNDSMNVRAMAIDGGILLDADALSEFPVKAMPHWVYLNYKSMANPLRMRPATQDEMAMLRKGPRYRIYGYIKASDTMSVIEGSADLSFAKRQVNTYYTQKVVDVDGFYVVDMTTGEVVHQRG